MMKVCSTKRKAAATVGEEGLVMKPCSAKRKAKEATSKECPSTGCTTERKAEEVASAAAFVTGVSEGGKVADAVAVVAAGGGLAQAENGMWIMPDKEVQSILSRKSDQIPEFRRKSFLPHQAWVRHQYESNNGVVLMDDEMAALRAEHRRELEEEFAEVLKNLDLSGGEPLSKWEISDRYSDFFESDEEEEGEEVVQVPIEAN